MVLKLIRERQRLPMSLRKSDGKPLPQVNYETGPRGETVWRRNDAFALFQLMSVVDPVVGDQKWLAVAAAMSLSDKAETAWLADMDDAEITLTDKEEKFLPALIKTPERFCDVSPGGPYHRAAMTPIIKRLLLTLRERFDIEDGSASAEKNVEAENRV